MTEQELSNLVADKIKQAYDSMEHPKKFFITENGRGVTDGGDLYNAVLDDTLKIMQKAMTDILRETVLKK